MNVKSEIINPAREQETSMILDKKSVRKFEFRIKFTKKSIFSAGKSEKIWKIWKFWKKFKKLKKNLKKNFEKKIEKIENSEKIEKNR